MSETREQREIRLGIYPGNSAARDKIHRVRGRYPELWTVFNSAHKLVALYPTVDELKAHEQHKQLNYYSPMSWESALRDVSLTTHTARRPDVSS